MNFHISSYMFTKKLSWSAEKLENENKISVRKYFSQFFMFAIVFQNHFLKFKVCRRIKKLSRRVGKFKTENFISLTKYCLQFLMFATVFFSKISSKKISWNAGKFRNENRISVRKHFLTISHVRECFLNIDFHILKYIGEPKNYREVLESIKMKNIYA